jgi:hypothetical protein
MGDAKGFDRSLSSGRPEGRTRWLRRSLRAAPLAGLLFALFLGYFRLLGEDFRGIFDA